ncbi:MAG TPA: hypothetical protein VIY47_04350, partial [Ignavibacteriaceae bacterium]
FLKISANEGAYLIRSGRISPWIIYLSANGQNLVSRFNEDHYKIAGKIIDPGYWSRKFNKAGDDVDYITTLLEQTGI